MTAKTIFSLLTAGILCCSLITVESLGVTSYSAYFGFSIATVAVSLIFFIGKYRDINKSLFDSIKLWQPAGMLMAIAVYIIAHGLLKDYISLSHYYWLVAAILLITVQWLGPVEHDGYLHTCIVLIAIIESIIVIFQWLGLLSSMNDLFTCTGTWINPNVTAMFLALCFFSQKNLMKKRLAKAVFVIQLSVILLAIILLQCRTAYIVSAILLLELYKPAKAVYKITIAKLAAVVLLTVLLAFVWKTDSTGGRLQIWKNSLQLISGNGFAGAGFGQFEKEYNTFVAARHLPGADHVFMPYNDFLELFIEGGAIGAVLWIAFLYILIRRFINDSHALALVVSFIIIQLTNFGFQAIPVFALFLIYTGSLLRHHKKIQYSQKGPLFKPIIIMIIIGELLLCTRLISMAGAFRQMKLIRAEYAPHLAVEKYNALVTTLNFSAVFHENYGDMFMLCGNYQAAGTQYRTALQTTSRPGVLGKCGWCYGQIGLYDSAVAYFKIIEKLQPFKYAPRMALLKLYEQKKDTAAIKQKAREIMGMPVKVPGEQVEKIKTEARKWLDN